MQAAAMLTFELLQCLLQWNKITVNPDNDELLKELLLLLKCFVIGGPSELVNKVAYLKCCKSTSKLISMLYSKHDAAKKVSKKFFYFQKYQSTYK